jgi:uncharacterized glyoxalase superfamily protein PhnB
MIAGSASPTRVVCCGRPKPRSASQDAASTLVFVDSTAEQIRELVTKGAMGMAAIIAVDDVHKTYEELVAKGVEFTEEPTERFYGTDCGLRDPFGNHLRIGTPKQGPIELPDPAQFAAENTP